MSPESLSARLRQLVVRERFAPDEATPVLEAATALDACIEALRELMDAASRVSDDDLATGYLSTAHGAARKVLARLEGRTP